MRTRVAQPYRHFLFLTQQRKNFHSAIAQPHVRLFATQQQRPSLPLHLSRTFHFLYPNVVSQEFMLAQDGYSPLADGGESEGVFGKRLFEFELFGGVNQGVVNAQAVTADGC